jgi:hypothetical protein
MLKKDIAQWDGVPEGATAKGFFPHLREHLQLAVDALENKS